jgi:hypothetical protein
MANNPNPFEAPRAPLGEVVGVKGGYKVGFFGTDMLLFPKP